MIGPRADSRYSFSYAEEDEGGRFVLSDYEPFRFRELPDSRTRVVVAGDTLYSLSKAYKTQIEEIKRLNGLNTASNLISVGQKLVVKA